MAVYFQKAERPWWAELAGTAANALLSNFIKGAMDRDQYARQKTRSNKEWQQVLGDPAAQVAAQQPAAMTVESSPDTNRLSSAITGATQTSPFGSDAIGFAPNAPKVNVPKQFLPTANDGLLGTSQKAVMANNYANSQVPTREELMRRVLTTMGPQNQEAAVKYLEYMYGPQWKVGDQIYRGRQMENILGALPGMQDKEGNRNYNNRAYMYGMDNLATGNLNFINPEYQRWFNESEAAKQRAFAKEQQQRQFANQWGLAKYNNAQQNYRAQLGQAALAAKLAAGGGTGRRGTANPFAGMSWSDIEKLNKMAQDAMPRIAGKSVDEARRILAENYDERFVPALEARFKGGSKDWTYAGKDDTGNDTTLTGANPFFQSPASAPAASVIGFAGNETDYAPDQAYGTTAFDYDDYWNRGVGVSVPIAGSNTSSAPTIGATSNASTEAGAPINFNYDPVAQIAKQQGKSVAQVQDDLAVRARLRQGYAPELAVISDNDVADFMDAHPEMPLTPERARYLIANNNRVPPEQILRNVLINGRYIPNNSFGGQ